MIYTKFTKRALEVAMRAHKDQTDPAGFPYILHPILVAEKQTEEMAAVAALLHDVVEDSDFDVRDLYEFGFPEKVVEAVKALTHKKGEPYDQYIERVKRNQIATAVKLADLEQNMDQARLAMCAEERRARLEKKQEVYRRAMERLLE